MLSQIFFNTIGRNERIIEFLSDNKEFEVLVRQIKNKELKIILNNYPELFGKYSVEHAIDFNSDENSPIICITLIKNHNQNYLKLKKLKLYFNLQFNEIIKILEN